jgi:hypothetical protein
MRKPVRSTVANRKYFQGGGLAPMKPAAPEEAVGIMASSQPLVDMVAQSASNPQGGMSPLNFDQGGLANVPVPQGVPKSRIRRFGEGLGRFFNPFRVTGAGQTVPALQGMYRYFKGVPTDPVLEEFNIDQFTATEIAKNRFPGQEAEVEKIARDLISKTPRITPENLGEQITQKLSVTPKTEAEKVMGEKIEQDQVFQPQREGRTTKPIPEENLKKIKEKGGALAKGLGLLEEDKTKDKTDKDEVIPEGTSAADGNIETEEFIFPGGREELEKEKNVINQNTDPNAEQTSEDRLGMLMKRFTDAAPKYEGLDSGLALMQMGAIMAGGTSPNAIKNIADALTVTSEKLIKDKSKRDEFNRQLNLSALQYGLGEISKEDAQKRQDDRNFITLVASKDGTNPLTGEKISKGENIRVSMTDMLNKDIPSMFKDKDMYVAELDAAVKAKKAVNDLINEQRKELILSDTAAVKQQELYNQASKQYIQSTAGLQFVDKALITLSEDEVTGLKGGAKDLTLKVATALGLKVGHKFKSKKEFEDSVKKAFQKLIPTALGGVQSANSISDRDVQFLADAYIESSILKGGTFNLVTVNEDILIGKLQTLRDTFIDNQKAGLSGMRQVNDFLRGRTRPGGGSAETYISEGQRRIKEFREKEIPTVGGLELNEVGKDDDGIPIFKISKLKSS